MKRFLIVFAVTLFPAPALAQISAPGVPAGSIGRYEDDRLQDQLQQVREREGAVGGGSQTGGVNAEGERLICRRASHGTESRMSRAPRLCLTARQWRQRQ